jgi:8-oxo-dGTP pyrophosphatase MutT (NUDIX family)
MDDPKAFAIPATVRNADITVAALIEDAGRFLLVEERAGGRIVFNQPAGHLEVGETLVDAVVRETFEETGYGFEPTDVLGLYHWYSEPDDATFLRVAFCGAGKAPSTTPELDPVIVATHWLTREQVLAQQNRLRSPMVLRCIDDYRAGTRFPLSCLAEASLEERLRQVGD